MKQDLAAKGVHVQKIRDRHNGKTYLLPVFDKVEFFSAIGKEPDDGICIWIEVGSAYEHWLRAKYPAKADEILKLEFEYSYKAFSQSFNKALEDAGVEI